jgi:hypothetical protein
LIKPAPDLKSMKTAYATIKGLKKEDRTSGNMSKVFLGKLETLTITYLLVKPLVPYLGTNSFLSAICSNTQKIIFLFYLTMIYGLGLSI